jgi:hypothetical protein
MNFKDFLKELQVEEAGEYSPVDPQVVASINSQFQMELGDTILSPEVGMQKIRKVVHRHMFDFAPLYDSDPEGDELVIDLAHLGEEGNPSLYLYVIYYLADEGYYDFYAEVGDEERMEELTSDDEDDTEED